jgi:hypothetical protein
MLERMGPSGLLRLAAVISVAASLLLAGCAASTPAPPQTAAEEKGGWSRCEPGRPDTITVVCWKR